MVARIYDGDPFYRMSRGIVGNGSTTHFENNVKITTGRKRYGNWVRKVTYGPNGSVEVDDYRLFDCDRNLLYADRWTPRGRAIVDLMRRNSESA